MRKPQLKAGVFYCKKCIVLTNLNERDFMSTPIQKTALALNAVIITLFIPMAAYESGIEEDFVAIAKHAVHKAARQPITQDQSNTLERELTLKEQLELQEVAQAHGKVFVKIPKQPGIAPLVASFLVGELTADELQQIQRELQAEAQHA